MSDYILEMNHITKTFGSIKALNDVTLQIKEGEIHALVGENGAGKSTLMNILSGVYSYGSFLGSVVFKGKECHYKNIKDSEKDGIVIIHQELALIPYLSIAENVFLGNEQGKSGIIDWNQTRLKATELLKKVGLDENPNTLITNIGVGKQQLIEIVRALAKNVKLLILDEPTAALNDTDSNKLLTLLLELKEQGVTSILISHKLNEVEKIADQITVIRDGKVIQTLDKRKDQITEDIIIKGMVGRDLENRFPHRTPTIGETYFEVSDWTVYHPQSETRLALNSINFNIRRGEIVGLAGLMGAGRTELAMSIFGKSYGHKITGTIKIDGKEVNLDTVTKAIKHKLAYVTEDRKNYGLILIDNIKQNITLANLEKLSEYNVIDSHKENIVSEEYRTKFNIKSSSVLHTAGNLSGGNQQKVVLSKWIFTDPEILILDEPTRGIDVGAKYEIYTIINRLAEEGKCILLISSEMPELLGICDRIYVVNDGEIAGELEKSDCTQENIMKCIMRHNKEGK